MVRIVCGDENQFVNYVKHSKCNLYTWGSGVILQICFRHILLRHNLISNIISCTESDNSKVGKMVLLGEKMIPVVSLNEMVRRIQNDTNGIIVVTCSYYQEILTQLDSIRELDNIRCVLLPMLYIENKVIDSRDVPVGQSSIPQKIHYCWFGEKPMPEANIRCLESWKKYCPDYEIVRWDETNVSVTMSPWVERAYKNKNYAFVSDYVRAWVLYNHGGYYFDVDVELITTLDKFSKQEAFVSFEKWPVINTGGGCGSIREFWYWKECMDIRDSSLNAKEDIIVPMASGYYDTFPLIERGMKTDGTLQKVDGMVCLPWEYFHPIDYLSRREEVTDKTCGIHYFNWSWADSKMVEGNPKEKNYYIESLGRSLTFSEL